MWESETTGIMRPQMEISESQSCRQRSEPRVWLKNALTEEYSVPLRQKSPSLAWPQLRPTRFSPAHSGNLGIEAGRLNYRLIGEGSLQEVTGARNDGAGKTTAKVMTQDSRLSRRGSMT